MTKPTIPQLEQLTTDIFTAYNDHDVDRLLSFHTEDIVLRHGTTALNGKAEVADYLTNLFQAFPDAEWPVAEVQMMMSPDHQRLAQTYLFRGTQQGNFQGLPGTGRHIEFRGVAEVQLDGLLTREVRLHMDTYDYLVQLGVLPDAEGLGFKAIALAEISLNKARQVLRV